MFHFGKPVQLFSDDDPQFSYRPSPHEHSSQSSASVRDLNRVHEFFRYSLPTFDKQPDHTPSTHTRDPAPYDKHLDEHLRLRRIVYVPTLVADLEAIADQALDDYVTKCEALPSTEDPSFPSPDVMKRLCKKSLLSRIKEEVSLQETYNLTIASNCLVVASTLEFQLPMWSSGHLEYTTQHPPGELHAWADGYFRVVNDAPLEVRAVSPLPEIFQEVTKYFPNLGVWEFKNLVAGSIEVFETIREYARMEEFPWVGCEKGEFCAIHNQTPSDGPRNHWSRMGPDASEPVCPSVRSTEHLEPPLPEHDLEYWHDKNAKYMIQQVWAELVKSDATSACLNAGNHELYFQRDRRKQTLYMSDIVKTTGTPGHARILTGFFIAILRDAKDRALQLKNSRPATWSDENPFRTFQTVKVLSPEEIRAEAQTRQWLVLESSESRSPLSSFVAASAYLRVSSNGNRSIRMPAFGPFFRIILPPQRHTGRGSIKVSGNKFPGIAGDFAGTVIVKSANQPEVLEKLEKEHRMYVHLENAGVTCIPRLIGFFKHANIDCDPPLKLKYSSLVLEDVGKSSLADFLKPGGKNMATDYMFASLQALKELHNANICVGLTEFSLDDIIIRRKEFQGRGLVSFVSLGRAFRTTKKWEKDEEFEALMVLLVNSFECQWKSVRLGNIKVKIPRSVPIPIPASASVKRKPRQKPK